MACETNMCGPVFIDFSLILDKSGYDLGSDKESRLHIWDLVTSLQVLSGH